MLHTINMRIERDVIRFEAPESRIFSTVPSTMITDAEGVILRAGMRPHEWEELTTAEDVTVPAHLRFVKPLDEPRDPKTAARFLHHIFYEFIQQIRDASGKGSWFTDRVDCSIEIDEPSDPAFIAAVVTELEQIALFQSCQVNGSVRFAKGRANQPAIRFVTIALAVVAAIALVVIPLIAIDRALDHNPAWRRLFLGVLALLTVAGTAAFLVYEKRRGRVGNRSLIFVAAIATLAVLQLVGAMMRE